MPKKTTAKIATISLPGATYTGEVSVWSLTKWLGKYKDGIAHGEGTSIYDDGGKYVGGWMGT